MAKKIVVHIHKTKDASAEELREAKELGRKIESELNSIKSIIPENVSRGEVKRLWEIHNILRKI